MTIWDKDHRIKEEYTVQTNGFIKKSNRTPGRELELARKYRKDYQERIGK